MSVIDAPDELEIVEWVKNTPRSLRVDTLAQFKASHARLTLAIATIEKLMDEDCVALQAAYDAAREALPDETKEEPGT